MKWHAVQAAEDAKTAIPLDPSEVALLVIPTKCQPAEVAEVQPAEAVKVQPTEVVVPPS